MISRIDFSFSTPYTELQVQEDHLPPKLSRLRTILLNFTQYGLNFMVLLLSVVVVPAQVEKMSGGTHKGRTMGGMVAGGAAVTFLLSPLIGMVSDRTTLRLGRRRPLMIIGTFFL
ncbi:IFT140, partial [Biomphalaria glabrata]